MDEHDYDPVLDSRYNCDKCEDSGIDIDTREYCEHCQSGARRCNNDKFAEMLRGSPFLEAMWTMNQATMKSERAIAAAEMALLKHRIAGLERELAEVRKDAERYRWMRDKTIVVSWSYQDESGNIIRCVSSEVRMDERIDFVAASVAQANKEQGNG